MHTVVYVRLSRGVYTVGIATEGECIGYSLTEAEYMSVGAPVKGVTVDGALLDEIICLDERHRALRRALGLLSHSDKNIRAMRARLRECGFGRSAADFATEECVRLGYIDERRQLSLIIPREANRALRGDRYIRAKLCSQGYSPKDVDVIMSELSERGEIDFCSSFSRLAEKKGALTEGDKRLLARKSGYSLKYVN